jgi:hypothetical protein
MWLALASAMPVEFANESAVLLLAMREIHAFRVKFSRMSSFCFPNQEGVLQGEITSFVLDCSRSR